ncbi:hypothetical protein [Dactylosporangium sp. NPDC049140]|jgi:hypothetical protein|uniref:hypothetical protein n=1 Tax=Dactylosporangium sp. NPDC049140 TaxID=3155647 RepID=UPI0034092827
MNDDEVADRLRNALHQFAGDAPPGVSMLTTVTTESARRGRRARLATLASGAAALVAIGAAVPFALRGAPAPEPVAAPPSPVASVPSPAGSATLAGAPAPATLVPATVPGSVAFPFSAPTGDGYGPPMVMLAAGRPTLLQSLPTGAPMTVKAYESEPARPTSKAQASPAKVGGQAATVYEWSWSDDDPANPDTGRRLSLVWHPAARTWLRVDADAAVALPLLSAYAGAFTPGGIKAEAPFSFKVMPGGWTVDNISHAVVTFAPPGVAADESFVDKIAVQLDEAAGVEPKLAGPETVAVTVGDRRGWLTTTSDGQFLQVPVEGGRSLLLQIGPRAALPTDVLLRFAAGIEVRPSAQVSQG